MTKATYTYVAYELPGAIACGCCGMLMLAHKDHAVYHVGDKQATFQCENPHCSDHGIRITIPYKRHEVEVQK